MNTAAVIAEYNPFHNGHLYQINYAREKYGITHVAAVMSGNFVQRGAPAIMDKFARAHIAASAGIAAVFELPFCYATAAAKDFATASVNLLNKLGCIDNLIFGAECDNLPLLQDIAMITVDEPASYSSILKENVANGLSFPAARSLAIESIYPGAHDLLAMPNNILAIEYLAALIRTNSMINPILIKRVGSGYHETTLSNEYASATAIRKLLQDGQTDSFANILPSEALAYITENVKKTFPVYANDLTQLLQTRLLNLRYHDTCSAYISNELEMKLRKTNVCQTFEEISLELKTKNITHATINRELIHLIHDLTYADVDAFKENGWIYYARLLAANDSTTAFLHKAKDVSSIPIITSPKNASKLLEPLGQKMLKYDTLSTDIYNLAVYNKYKTELPNEFTRKFTTTK